MIFLFYLSVVNLDVGHIILEHSRHVDLGELVLAEDDEQACFAARTVADDHQLFAHPRRTCIMKRATKIHHISPIYVAEMYIGKIQHK